MVRPSRHTYFRGTCNFCFTSIIYNQFVIEYVLVYEVEALVAFATIVPTASIVLGVFSMLTHSTGLLIDSMGLVTEPTGLLTEPISLLTELTDILTDSTFISVNIIDPQIVDL
jgi:hypothetical protein